MHPTSLRVLLIEDVAEFAQLMQQMLQAARGVAFEVDWAQSLSEGLVRLQSTGIDLVLLDLSLSGTHGLESFEQAWQRTSHIPIIVLSSSDDEELALRAVQEGAQDYLVKGEINGNLLVRSIRYAVERKRAEKALVRAEEKFRSIFEHSV